ncbi:MAG: His-Xaa-Ser system radical SAM maturase HxsB [Treponema sp.]|nr:His-Xaa-Ser system radical SAM maturase HxsB [Treponema sp.]
MNNCFFEQFSDSYLLTNSAGEHLFISKEDFARLKENPDTCSENTRKLLKSRFFLCEKSSETEFRSIYDIKYSTKHSYLENESLLLMVVPTISCNCSCVYCQVNSRKNNAAENDMSLKTVLAFCDFVFALPHKNIKIEFQGGEPSLRFDTIEFIVRRVRHLNRKYHKEIEYVICTNLLNLTAHELRILKKFKIAISTSLDGSKAVHDKNRPSSQFPSSYDSLVKNVELARKNKIYPSALVTVTALNLNRMTEIIDTYIENHFESIFIRPLNNYGCAFQNKSVYYKLEDYIAAYKNALLYLIERNLNDNICLREEMFSILLRKIFSPFNDGFVDMQNPCALGQMCMIVKQNGDVYPSDESRMISEMGNEYWKMGNVNDKNCFVTMKEKRNEILENGWLENYTECKDCVYSPFCYADPIKKWYIQNIAGEEYESYCGIRKELFRFVFEQIHDADEKKLALFRRWANA